MAVRVAWNGVVDIVDHGAGVAPEDRIKVFQPFWRASSTGSGAGLGLAIVKEIADRHGVVVSVDETDGGGATFRFAFEPDGPARAAPLGLADAETVASPLGGGRLSDADGGFCRSPTTAPARADGLSAALARI